MNVNINPEKLEGVFKFIHQAYPQLPCSTEAECQEAIQVFLADFFKTYDVDHGIKIGLFIAPATAVLH